MTNDDHARSDETLPSKGWLPSPGCLFSVTLLMMLASVCFWFGWRAYVQQARLQYFRTLGARVDTEPAEPVWLHDLVAARLGDEYAAGFTDATRIELESTNVTDAGLQNLRDLTRLQKLRLDRTQVTDAGLQDLTGLTGLEVLYLGNTRITDAGLEHLIGLSKLRELWLFNTDVTDVGLGRLSGMSNLQGLCLMPEETVQDSTATIEPPPSVVGQFGAVCRVAGVERSEPPVIRRLWASFGRPQPPSQSN